MPFLQSKTCLHCKISLRNACYAFRAASIYLRCFCFVLFLLWKVFKYHAFYIAILNWSFNWSMQTTPCLFIKSIFCCENSNRVTTLTMLSCEEGALIMHKNGCCQNYLDEIRFLRFLQNGWIRWTCKLEKFVFKILMNEMEYWKLLWLQRHM